MKKKARLRDAVGFGNARPHEAGAGGKGPATRATDDGGLGDNPLAGGEARRDPLVEHFYHKRVRAKGRQPLKDGRTFRLVTFSFYEEDVARLDGLLEAAKQHGHKRVSRSQIVRLALRQVDVRALPDIV
jgi:hypothetical protein